MSEPDRAGPRRARGSLAAGLAMLLGLALAGLLPLALWRAAFRASVERLVPQLGAADPALAAAAQARVEALGPDAVPVLIASFGSTADAFEPGRPQGAVIAGETPLTIPIMTCLRALPRETVVPRLIEALDAGDGNVRHSSALTLAWIGADALPALIETLRSAPELRRRVSAAWIVAFLGPAGEPALPALREALQSPEKDLRYTARYAIAQIGSTDDALWGAIDHAKSAEK